LHQIHEDYKHGKITKADILKFKNDPFWMDYVFENVFTALALVDLKQGIDIINAQETPNGSSSKDWTVGTIFKSYKGSNEVEKVHRKMAREAMVATAMMEALLSTTEEDGTGFDHKYGEVISHLYTMEDPVKINFGHRTTEYFPQLEATRQAAKRHLYDRAVMYEMEKRIKSGVLNPNETGALLHHVACTYRSTTLSHMGIILDQRGFGAERKHWYHMIPKNGPLDDPDLEFVRAIV